MKSQKHWVSDFPPCSTLKKSPSHRVHFEVDELSARESDDDLPPVDGAPVDRFLAWGPPLVDPLVGPDVTNAVGVNLDESVVAQGRARQGGRRSQEPRVRHLLDSLANRQDQGGVDERHDDVRVELVCKTQAEASFVKWHDDRGINYNS